MTRPPAPQDLSTLKNENRFFKAVTTGSPKTSGSAKLVRPVSAGGGCLGLGVNPGCGFHKTTRQQPARRWVRTSAPKRRQGGGVAQREAQGEAQGEVQGLRRGGAGAGRESGVLVFL